MSYGPLDAEQREMVKQYLEKLSIAESILERLCQFTDDYGKVSPDTMTWANVGDMTQFAGMLGQAERFIRGGG